jgi:hypothetical protein
VISTPCKLLIRTNIAVLLDQIISFLVLLCFFVIFRGILDLILYLMI